MDNKTEWVPLSPATGRLLALEQIAAKKKARKRERGKVAGIASLRRGITIRKAGRVDENKMISVPVSQDV